MNKASAENDNEQIIFDLRSYIDRGIDREPQQKIGPKVTYLEKRGYQTQWKTEVEKPFTEIKAGRDTAAM